MKIIFRNFMKSTCRLQDFVLNILFVIIYFIIRNKVEPGNKLWFSKKELILSILSIPFMIIILYVIGIIRLGNKVEYSGLIKTIKDFFESQGISLNIVGYVEIFKDKFPIGHYYMFGGILDFLKHNALSSWLFHIPNYPEHTVERALYGDSLGQTLTYIVFPANYISGIGMGSSYIAEAYHDFGYFGIAFINAIYGVLMGRICVNKKRNVWIIAFKLLMIKGLLYAPRSAADGFITNIISIPNIFGTLILWFGCRLLCERSGNRSLYKRKYCMNK